MFMYLEVIGITVANSRENCPIRSQRFYFKLGQELQKLTDKTYVDLKKKLWKYEKTIEKVITVFSHNASSWLGAKQLIPAWFLFIYSYYSQGR